MKRKGLYFLIALALGGVGAVHAQDTTAPSDTADSMTSSSYDGRWYIAPTLGGYYNDTYRDTNSRQLYYGLGVGRFISPNTSLDIFVDRTSRDVDGSHSWSSWSNGNVGVTARYYFGTWDAWRPYILTGLMGSYHDSVHGDGWSPAAELGGGLSKTINDNSDFRVEAGYRYDWDNDSLPQNDGYGDWFLGVSLVTRFGDAAAAPVVAPPVEAPPPADCSTMDADGDSVNDCEDKCPATATGTIVGPDGCATKVVIDLRGVNFKYDRPKKGETDISKSLAEPSADSVAVLNQAIDTLQRYPQVKVTVAGYTDSKGTDEYNQSLSERRASIVYNYLTSHGIDASRLEGPIGHGETNPIGDNDTDAGRAQNRRTELQVQQ